MLSMNEVRKQTADARRSMIIALTEQIVSLLRDSGASEEEALAALDCAKIIAPLQQMESCKRPRHF